MSRTAGDVMTKTAPATIANGAPKRARRQTVTPESRISSGDKHLEWIPVAKMAISEIAQRRHDSASSRLKIADIAENFDPDKFGTLTVNLRGGTYWVIDGGHRYHAVVEIGWEDQALQCWAYEGLSEAEEADKFLALNDVKAVSTMDKYKQAIVANHPVETDIDRIVRAADLRIGSGRDGIGCVGTILKIYNNGGGEQLAATMRIIRDSFGVTGFKSKVVEGVGLFVHEYWSEFSEDVVVGRLSVKKGGVAGLLGEAERIAIKYSVSLSVAIAAAVVETHNRGRTGPRLSTWWSTYSGTN